MKVTVIGAGYVGCVSAACLAKLGHDLVVVDTDKFKIDELRAGKSPILEPGLDDLIRRVTADKKLTAGAPSDDTVASADVVIICVSTPSLKAGGVDTRPLQRVLVSVGHAIKTRRAPLTVVVRSTVAPNRLRQLAAALPAEARDAIRLVANPEFLRETTAIADFEKPPFILVGGDDEEAVARTASLYRGIEAPVHKVSLESALLVKYASNAFHALKIAFANEIATVARALEADPREVMSVFAEDRILNISSAYLRPGFAFGGSCLPKDVRALVALGREKAEPLLLLRSVLESNRLRIETAADEVAASGATKVALLGLSFKKGTDDVRESPYVLLAELLVGRGIAVRIYDPEVDLERTVGANRQYLAEHLPGLAQMMSQNIQEALADADALVVCKRVLERSEIQRIATGFPRVFDLEYLL
jgi:GDP-mannose 6-dehydrogenase